jgi:hypothetical protein
MFKYLDSRREDKDTYTYMYLQSFRNRGSVDRQYEMSFLFTSSMNSIALSSTVSFPSRSKRGKSHTSPEYCNFSRLKRNTYCYITFYATINYTIMVFYLGSIIVYDEVHFYLMGPTK